MKKKIVPILVVLALVIVGIGGYFLGREFNTSPSLETPPAESSTPEVTPDTTPEATPVVETTSPEPAPETETMEPSVEPVSDTAAELGAEQDQAGFAEALYTIYVKASKADEDGVPVYDKAVWDLDTKEIWRTSGGHETQYICIGVGYGDYDGWIEIINANGEMGYTQSAWFTQELEVGGGQQAVEQQKPAQTEQQKPAQTEQQKPSTNNQSGNNNSGNNQANQGGKIEIDYSQIPGYRPDEAPRIPEEDQIHDGGDSHEFESDTNLNYTGKLSG